MSFEYKFRWTKSETGMMTGVGKRKPFKIKLTSMAFIVVFDSSSFQGLADRSMLREQ